VAGGAAQEKTSINKSLTALEKDGIDSKKKPAALVFWATR